MTWSSSRRKRAISSRDDVCVSSPSIHLGSCGRIREAITPISRENVNRAAVRTSNDPFSDSSATSVASEAWQNASDTSGGGSDAGELVPGIQSEKPLASVPRAMIS